MKAILAAGAAAALLATLGSGVAAAQGQRQGQGPYPGQGQGQYQPPGQPQPQGQPQALGRPSITLYQLPNYQGASRTWTGSVDNLADQGFNDLAQSARVDGRWRVCEDARLRGRCVDLSGDVPNLADLRMTAAISSFQDQNRGGGFGGPQGGIDRGPYTGGGTIDRGPQFGRPNDGGFAGEALDGRSASFFPRPGPGPYRNADEFCRRLGFAGVIYADDRGQGLRDVLCRR